VNLSKASVGRRRRRRCRGCGARRQTVNERKKKS